MIIPKRTISIEKVVLIAILALGAFLRLYRIPQLTEFLGDQGREGVVIYEAFRSGTIPLVGPPVSTGQYLGPFFYYLIALPFHLSGYNPVVPAVFMGILGVCAIYVVFLLVRGLAGAQVALMTALFMAVSATMVTSDRILWNPTPIPLFTLLSVLSLYATIEKKSLRWAAVLGFSCAALVQLHYTAVIVSFVLFLTFLYVLFRDKKKGFGLALWVSILAGLATSVPFFTYEWQNGFRNTKSILLQILMPDPAIQHAAGISFIQILEDSIGVIVPISHTWILAAFALGISTIVFVYPVSSWARRTVFWYLAGAGILSLYKGPFHIHYEYFLRPFAFLVSGLFLAVIYKRVSRIGITIIIVVIAVVQLIRTDVFSKGFRDIPRTQALVNEMVTMSDGEPFAFTVIKSRSFSDYHYRFFFRIHTIKPEEIDGNNYSYLFLICESVPCPAEKDVINQKYIQSLCYDQVCNRDYPKVSLEDAVFVGYKLVGDATIYAFKYSDNQDK